MSEANRTEEVSRLSTYFLISEQVRRQSLTGMQLQAMPEYVEMEHSTLDIFKKEINLLMKMLSRRNLAGVRIVGLADGISGGLSSTLVN